VNSHPLERPLFIYAAWNSVHYGNWAPLQYSEGFPEDMPYEVSSQVSLLRELDDAISNVSSAMKARGMWEHTVFVVTTDHGQEEAINGYNWNEPLRGTKFYAWEGAIRLATFVGGGFLPIGARGTKREGITHLVDWYATFCGLAGVDTFDQVAADAGLPLVESLDLWPMITGSNLVLSRQELPLIIIPENMTLPENHISTSQDQLSAFISGEYKYLQTTRPDSEEYDDDCKAGCLFNIIKDPQEAHDLVFSEPEVAAKLRARLEELRKDVLAPQSTCKDDARAYQVFEEVWGGFIGPYLEFL